jgi:hypothetical protein
MKCRVTIFFLVQTIWYISTYDIGQYVSAIRIEVINSMTWHHANYTLNFRISGVGSYFLKKNIYIYFFFLERT